VATVGEAAIQPSVSQDGDVMIYADAPFSSSIIKASFQKPGVFTQTVTLSSPNSQNNSAPIFTGWQEDRVRFQSYRDVGVVDCIR
jgi:hypothetical protein